VAIILKPKAFYSKAVSEVESERNIIKIWIV
jgi:hypothetical protein